MAAKIIPKLIANITELTAFYHEAAEYNNVKLETFNLVELGIIVAAGGTSGALKDAFAYYDAYTKVLEIAGGLLRAMSAEELVNYYLSSKSEGTLKKIEIMRNETADMLMMARDKPQEFEDFTRIYEGVDGAYTLAQIDEYYTEYSGAYELYLFGLGLIASGEGEDSGVAKDKIDLFGYKLLGVEPDSLFPEKAYNMWDLPYMYGMRPVGGWTNEDPGHGIIIKRDGFSTYDYDLRALLGEKGPDLKSGLNAEIIEKNNTIAEIEKVGKGVKVEVSEGERKASAGATLFEKSAGMYRALYTNVPPRTRGLEQKYLADLDEEIGRWILPAIAIEETDWQEKIGKVKRERLSKWMREEMARIKMPAKLEDLFDAMADAGAVERMVSRDIRERIKEGEGREMGEDYRSAGLLRARALKTEYMKCLEGGFRRIGAGNSGLADFGRDGKRIAQYFRLISEDVIEKLSANKIFDDTAQSLKALAVEHYFYKNISDKK